MPDASYLARVEGRATALERTEIAARHEITRTHQELARALADIEIEFERLREELVAVEHDMKATVDRAKTAVGGFKRVVKKGDFVRLQARADQWSPETRITREQFKRLLQDGLQ